MTRPTQIVIVSTNQAGKPRTVTDPNGNTVTTVYYGPGSDGRLKQRIDPVGRASTFVYDANGNVTSVTDNLNRTTTTTYDELNRPTRIVGPLVGTIRPLTRYTSDPLGCLVQVEAGTFAHAQDARDLPAPARLQLAGELGHPAGRAAALEEMLAIPCTPLSPPALRSGAGRPLPPQAWAVASAALARLG